MHLLVDITAHGYGHLSQTAPVVNELSRRIPGLRVTIRCAAPPEVVRGRLDCTYRQIQRALDFGMKMHNAVEVDAVQSLDAYRAYHDRWDDKVAHAAREMQELAPDLVLANVPYLSLAAAHAAGIPAAAMCCLNWADLFRHYFPAESAIHTQMLAAYNSASVFLKVQPTMPMPDLRNGRTIGLIARRGVNRRHRLTDVAAAPDTTRFVLVVMGGIEFRLPMERWPRLPGVHWLVPMDWNLVRDDITTHEALDIPFSDIVASCDALLTKPGYGTFSEAAAMGKPVLYVTRNDWPEQPFLVSWLQQHGICREADQMQLQTGDLAATLQQLWSTPRPPAPDPSGVEEATEVLMAML